MRKLIIYILLLCFSTASAQVDYFTLLRESGTRMGVVEHLAPANPNGKKDPVLVWLHGVDGNRSAPISPTDTTRIAVVTNKGPLRLVRDGTPLPLFQKPGTTGADGRYRWNIVAPQNPFSGNNVWACDVVASTFDYVRAHPEKWDTSLIILVGYSLGGRGIKTCITNSKVLPYVKYAVDIAGGTYLVGASTTAAIANAGIPYDAYITVSDELVTNYSQTDNMINSIKSQTPKVVPNYVRFVDITQSTTFPTGGTMANPEHDFIEFLIARDTTNGDTETTTNGDTWTKTNDNNIFIRGLRFFGPRRQDILLPAIPLMFRRRKKKKTKEA